LTKGTADQVLTSDGTDIAWADASGGGISGLTGLVENNSIWLGNDPSGTTDTASYNVAVGTTALDAITTGDYNVAIGYNAMTAATSGQLSVGIGYLALQTDTDGYYNTAIGTYACQTLDGGRNNIAVGQGSMRYATTAISNTAVGHWALSAVTDQSGNVAVGYLAGEDLTAANNTLIGYEAGLENTSGADNTAVGYKAMGAGITTGDYNVAVGSNALAACTSGDNNVVMGYDAFTAATIAQKNVVLGRGALAASVGGLGNVAIGNYAMTTSPGGDPSEGVYNVIIGEMAGAYMTISSVCVGIGQYALGRGTTTGNGNIAIGREAGAWMAAGLSNVLLGSYAGTYITGGTYNTCLGHNAFSGASSGAPTNNIVIGKDSGTSGSPGGDIDDGSNEIYLGDENITNANIQVAWSVASDKRDKNDIEPLTLGLEFINQLEPVTYRWDKRTKYINKSYLYLEPDDPDFVDLNNVVHDGTHTEPQLHAGLLAQDVEEVEQAYGFDKEDLTALVTKLSNDGKSYSLSYERFVPMLIKAVQELSAEVEELKSKLDE